MRKVIYVKNEYCTLTGAAYASDFRKNGDRPAHKCADWSVWRYTKRETKLMAEQGVYKGVTVSEYRRKTAKAVMDLIA